MWNTRIVWRVFQVPLKFFVTNYYIFIVCVQSFAFAVQSDSVRRPVANAQKKTEQAWVSTCSVYIVSLWKLSINRRFPDSS